MIKKFIIKKEINMEFRNNTSLFLITPTMCVLIILFPILSENRFRVDNDIFLIVELLFLIIFTPSNLRLDSEQLGSEFLQDARSKKMRSCCGAS